MIAAELRGGNKPSLNEALGWIGSRVDDIYGASVGRLEDVWIDPGTGVPRWLLVKEGRFGGRTTLIPFEDATAGAGHVWVPYEREIVRDAPEIEPGAPLTQQVEAALRSHYAANVPAAISHGTQQADQAAGQSTPPAPATATIRFATGGSEQGEPAAAPDFGRSASSEPLRPDEFQYSPPQQGRPPEPPRRAVLREQPPLSRVRGVIPPLPPRPAPPTPVPPSQPYSVYPPQAEPEQQQQRPGWQMPPAPQPQYQQQSQPPPPPLEYPQQQYQPPAQWQPPPQQPPPPPPQQPPPQPGPGLPANPYEALASLANSQQSHYVEIELSGELSIRGELRSVRVIPRDPGA